MKTVQFRTDFLLWAITAGCVFIALGFVDPLAGAVYKGDCSLWAMVVRFVTGDYCGSTYDRVIPIVYYGLLLAIPAATLGWVAQALVVVLQFRGGEREKL